MKNSTFTSFPLIGYTNVDDIFARMIRGVTQIHAMPNVPQLFDVTPVNIAAEFVVKNVYSSHQNDPKASLSDRIFHLVNSEQLTAAQLIYLMNAKCDFFVNLVTPDLWIQMIQCDASNPLLPLLPKLQQWAASLSPVVGQSCDTPSDPPFSFTAESLTQSAMVFAEPAFTSHLVDIPSCEELFLKMVKWMRERGHIGKGLTPLMSNTQARTSLISILRPSEDVASLSNSRARKRFNLVTPSFT